VVGIGVPLPEPQRPQTVPRKVSLDLIEVIPVYDNANSNASAMNTGVYESCQSFRSLARLVLKSALPRPQKAVLQALLAYARPDLTVYHAQGQLAWECDYTRPVIRKALAALEAQAILRVLQGPRQHRATEYTIDLTRLPSRAPYYAQDTDDVPTDQATSSQQGEIQLPAELAPLTSQRTIELPAEDVILPAQHETDVPSDGSEGHSVFPSGQINCPPVVQEEQEKKFLLRSNTGKPLPLDTSGHHPLPSTRPQRQRVATRPPETSAPETLPLADDLRHWAADTVPGLSLERERDKFLCYARAHGRTHVDGSEALKFWWLEAHARAVRRGALQLPAAPRPAPVPEPPPLYDAELHAQMQVDIARLFRPTGPSILETNENQAPRPRRSPSLLTAEGATLERDPAYLARIQARKAMLQAQAALLRAQEPCLDAVGAAD
jgi:hypothetical protein